MTEKELLNGSNQKHETRSQAGKDCRAIVKKISQLTGMKSDPIHRLKNCWFKRGNGWDTDKVTVAKGAENVDPITSLFARLIQLVNDHEQAGILGDLDAYLEDLTKHGIKITIDSPDLSYNPTVHGLIVDLTAYQQVIQECDDEIKEMGEDAEQIQFAPKTKFPSIASLAYKKSKGKDIGDTCQAQIEEALLTEKALTTLQSIEFDEEE